MSRLHAARRYWRRCIHRSHRWRLPCLRGQTYDGLCGHHWDTCFATHRGEDQ